jgi:hypothetical protein
MAAAFGLSIFGVIAWRAVTVQRADANEAVRQFDAIHASMEEAALVRILPSGRAERRVTAPTNDAVATQLHVLAYHAGSQQLVRADVPLWFFTVKGPAVRYALRDTNFDLDAVSQQCVICKRWGRPSRWTRQA